ncbi:DUF485 domain-containing protein [Pseudomonas sp. REB1044]|uniref:DUF485 domain-containing protein n=1 Tax=Pseudomonas sp. REB1044 TaxID=2675224 RepID=UPI00315D4C3A
MAETTHDVKPSPTTVAPCIAKVNLIRRRRQLCGQLTLLMLGAYFGFILILVLKPTALATALPGATVTWGFVAGFGLFGLTFFIVAVYVSWANRVFDPLVAQAREGGRP